MKLTILAALLTLPLLPSGPTNARSTHWILQFRSTPDRGMRRELARRGVRVLEDVPSLEGRNSLAVIASFPPTADLRGLDIVWTGKLTPANRIAPDVKQASAYLVVFHADVGNAEARRLLGGFRILNAPGLESSHFLVVADLTRLPELATHDEVSSVLSGGMPLPPLRSNRRNRT